MLPRDLSRRLINGQYFLTRHAGTAFGADVNAHNLLTGFNDLQK
jgi:hypothetical protein